MLYNGRPTKDLNYYWVQVGYGNGGMMRTIFHFYIQPKTFEVFYVDLATSRGGLGVLSLNKWRQLRNTPGWNKAHYYEYGKLVVDRGE
ncbi:hypothetical protein [Mucilaginibacter sp.]|uniref:hypothetical protein n=1 Tax=Mucilaginibacter sp. TaxID=1882438 RepID=UPI0032663BDA